jgi:predicted kinase
MKNTLYILRGLPGSGKSTYASKHLPTAMHFEADRFFINEQLEYKFDAKLINVAHQWCFSNTIRALRNNRDAVVSNTFTRMWELEKYLSLKENYDIDVDIKIIEIKTQFENVHGVSADKLEKMRNRWEEIPEELGLDITRVE